MGHFPNEIPMNALTRLNLPVLSLARKGLTLLLLASFGLPATAHAENFWSRLLGGLQTQRMEFSHAGQTLSLKVRGSMIANDSETDFSSVAGTVIIEERRDGQTRSLTVKGGNARSEPGAGKDAPPAAASGELSRIWRVNGVEQPFDAEARRWLARVLPGVLRETGLQREARIQRIVAAGGVDAVLAEIGLIQSGHARKRYLQSLLARSSLNDKQFQAALKLVSGIEGEHDKRGALAALATTQTLSAPQQVALLGVIAGMESDFEQRSALAALAPRLTPVPAVQNAWINTLRTLDSDYQRREAIVVLTRKGQQPAHADLALQSLQYIDSDFERGQALGMVLRSVDAPSPAQMMKMAEAIRGMRSDFEQRNAMARLVRRADPDSATAQVLLKVVQGMESAHEQSASLIALARTLPRDASVIEAYRAVLRPLPEHEREPAERALARRL